MLWREGGMRKWREGLFASRILCRVFGTRPDKQSNLECVNGDKTQLLGRSSRDAYSFSALFFEDQYYFVLLTSSVKSVLEDSRNPLQSQPHWCHYTCHQFVCVCACVRKSQKEICSVTVPGGSALSVLQYLFLKNALAMITNVTVLGKC